MIFNLFKKRTKEIASIYEKIYHLEDKEAALLSEINYLKNDIKNINEYLNRYLLPMLDYLDVSIKIEYVDDPSYYQPPAPKMPVYKFVKRKK